MNNNHDGRGESMTTSTEVAGSAIVQHDAMLRNMTYKQLQDFPKMRAEVIAKHYASLAHTALQLLRIIEATRYAPPTENMEHAECAIEYLTKQIQHAHDADFGIPLDWPSIIVN